ncbi:MAG: tyrosine-type recombinase/integrase [Gemmatimonadales bacterium]
MAKAKPSWSYKAGEKGRNRVRVYFDTTRKVIFAEFYERLAQNGGERRCRVSLSHGDREAAKQYAEDLAARFRKEGIPVRAPDLTLQTLFDIYEREVTPFKSDGKQAHDRRARRLFERCWGRETVVAALDRRDWDRFIRDRRSGKVKPPGGYHKGGVRDRQIEYDLRFVVAVCNWAVVVRQGGQPLLGGNPFRGFPVPGEQNINQPITSDREVAVMRAVADQVDSLCPLYLELTYWTGHRCMAVSRLRWRDFDLVSGTVRWTAEHDKTGFEHVVPLDETVLELLRAQRSRTPSIGKAWVFPSPTDQRKPMSRNLARDWWERLEQAAGLRHIKGRGWHSLRRRFATDLDHLPLKQLMDLGGWRTPASVVRYQKPTTEQLRAGLKTRRRGVSAS